MPKPVPGPRPLVTYVTSHGFGHLNRTVAVLNRIPEEIPIIIRCQPNLFDHWRDRLKRSVELQPHVSDSGAVNPPGNSAETDPKATLELAEKVYRENILLVDEESRLLQNLDAAAVLSDAPPLPILAASRANIPSYILANFTWADIYQPMARRLGGKAPELVRKLRDAYGHATMIFRASPGLPMLGIAPILDVGIVATPGRKRSQEIRAELAISDNDRIVYMYMGRYGQDSLEWERLTAMGRHGIQFVGFHGPPPDRKKPENLHLVRPEKWTGTDLAASADVIVAKAGYGSVCEAMLAETPLIYAPRTHFAEHRALDQTLKAWGGGLLAPRRAFESFRLEKWILRALECRPGPCPFPTDGAERIADHLTRVCRGREIHQAG